MAWHGCGIWIGASKPWPTWTASIDLLERIADVRCVSPPSIQSARTTSVPCTPRGTLKKHGLETHKQKPNHCIDCKNQKVDAEGIEPPAFRMRSGRSTRTEPRAHETQILNTPVFMFGPDTTGSWEGPPQSPVVRPAAGIDRARPLISISNPTTQPDPLTANPTRRVGAIQPSRSKAPRDMSGDRSSIDICMPGKPNRFDRCSSIETNLWLLSANRPIQP